MFTEGAFYFLAFRLARYFAFLNLLSQVDRWPAFSAVHEIFFLPPVSMGFIVGMNADLYNKPIPLIPGFNLINTYLPVISIS